ncbi:hypothetical protein MNV49_001259 [Pseudohyphozyma bogoriensis]|nr:hypothetical protein MNV49_001259 [Pseudohyphozyma bogoriensis]
MDPLNTIKTEPDASEGHAVPGPVRRKAGAIRVMSKAFDPATQACSRCHKRKRKCDRTHPTCGSCAKVGAECVYDVKITDKTHPGYVPGLLTEIQGLKERVAWLEAVAGSLEPNLANIATLATGSQVPDSVLMARSASSESESEGTRQPTTTAATTAEEPPSIGSHLFAAASYIPTARASATDWSNVAKRILRLNGQAPPRVESMADTTLLGGTRVEREASDEDTEEDDPASQELATLPAYDQSLVLVQAFFSNTGQISYPCLDRRRFMAEMDLLYREKFMEREELTQGQRTIIFRVFLVLAIGLIHLEQFGAAQWGSSASFHNRAMLEMEAVLMKEDVRCVESIVLLAVYTMFQAKGPSLWSVSGLASRLAIGLGLHRKVDVSGANISEKALEGRRCTWWAVYSLDRLVSFSFGRPVAIQDEDIDVELPKIPTEGNDTSFGLPSMVFSHHIIRMRRIGGLIQREVYRIPSAQLPAEEREAIIARLQRELDEWFEATPQGHTPSQGVFHHAAYFALWYNLLLSAIYRPSPLLPHTSRARLQMLRLSSTRSIELFWELHKDRRIASNHVNLQQMFIGCISLLFCLCEYDGDRNNALSPTWRHAAVERLQSCSDLLSSFSTGWPATKKYQETFDRLAELLIVKCHTSALQEPAAVYAEPSAPAVKPSQKAPPVLPAGVVQQPGSLGSSTSPQSWSSSDGTTGVTPPSSISDSIFLSEADSPHEVMSNLWVGSDAILGQYVDLSGIPPPDETSLHMPELSVDPFQDSYYSGSGADFGDLF